MTSVLLVVDVQADMLLPPEPVPDAGTVGPAIERVLDRARAAGARVVHIRNTGGPGDPDEPGTPGWELIHRPRDGEPVLDKTTADAFASTDLADRIPPGTGVVLIGMQSEFCVRDTALGALGHGYRVTLVRGAHATYDAGVAEQVEAELAGAGVDVVEPADLAF
jgi:nicotinamidase-related amidase